VTSAGGEGRVLMAREFARQLRERGSEAEVMYFVTSRVCPGGRAWRQPALDARINSEGRRGSLMTGAECMIK
jgi:hypothetical protein